MWTMPEKRYGCTFTRQGPVPNAPSSRFRKMGCVRGRCQVARPPVLQSVPMGRVPLRHCPDGRFSPSPRQDRDVLSPELEYEGANLPLKASEVGEARGSGSGVAGSGYLPRGRGNVSALFGYRRERHSHCHTAGQVAAFAARARCALIRFPPFDHGPSTPGRSGDRPGRAAPRLLRGPPAKGRALTLCSRASSLP
jgi:hypothetical protein